MIDIESREGGLLAFKSAGGGNVTVTAGNGSPPVEIALHLGTFRIVDLIRILEGLR